MKESEKINKEGKVSKEKMHRINKEKKTNY